MFLTVFRILLGFLLACLAAAFATVLYVITPAELISLDDDALAQRLADVGMLTLLTATYFAVFAAVLALVAAIIAEWQSIRGPTYYVVAALAIALVGFLAQYSSEAEGQATIFNSYAFTAFITAGFFSGLVYWLVAGRAAGLDPGAGPSLGEQSGKEGGEASGGSEPHVTQATAGKA